MSSSIAFRDARIPSGTSTGNQTELVDIHAEDGVIVAVTPPGARSTKGREVDLGGALVIPGAIDGHVHFDDPGYAIREDFDHGTASAAAGGVTTVVDMPCTSVPDVTGRERLLAKDAVIAPKARVDYALWGGVHAGEVHGDGAYRGSMADLVAEGVVGFKVYTVSGMPTYPRLSTPAILDVCEEARALDSLVCVHAEDPELVEGLEAELRGRGLDEPHHYAASRPVLAEVIAIRTVAEIAREAKARLHIAHLSSARGLAAVSGYKAERVDISAETCPHFLEFTEADLRAKGSILKTAPVVKGEADRDALWAGLVSGAVDYVATDHAPCRWPVDKSTGSIWTDYAGMPGTELMVPYLLSEGVGRGRLSLSRMVELVATAPAKRLGLHPTKGVIAVGADCDLAVLDPDARWTVRGAKLRSKGKFTPLEGYVLRGAVTMTICRGEVVYDRSSGRLAAPGTGRRVRAKKRL